MKRIWIRGEALRTLFALHELQVGEEVELKREMGSQHISSSHPDQHEGSRYYVHSVDADPYWPINLTESRRNIGDTEAWDVAVSEEAIAAWRPKKTG